MKHTLKTTLALLFAGVINLSAQTHESEIFTLRNAPGFSYSSPTSVALKDSILTETAVSATEVMFVRQVLRKTNASAEASALVITALADKGSLWAQAHIKAAGDVVTGWTQGLVLANPVAACKLALRSADSADEIAFKTLVFTTLQGSPFTSPQRIAAFKAYRAALPAEQQIIVTGQLKAVLLAVPVRSDVQNAFLASLSADLIALQLDQ